MLIKDRLDIDTSKKKTEIIDITLEIQNIIDESELNR